MIKWILTKIVGSKNQREIKKLRPIVDRIVNIEREWQGQHIDQQFLIDKTREWQSYLHRFLPMAIPPLRLVESADKEQLTDIAKMLNDRFDLLKPDFPNLPRVESTPDSIEAAKKVWRELTPEFAKLREKYLNKILPEAFAVAKAGARQLCGLTKSVCGQEQTWDMVHFNVQLLGGISLHRGYISEMATGEGKTLVATLPVYLNALTGMGVHVVTVNDYLARRDSEWMGTLFEYLGLTVGCIQSMMPSHLRREQYNCDITYGTNAEFGFDYLRDNGMASSAEEQVQRGHYFAIIDEVDSILIDEARTPLIISGPSVITREQQYDALCPAVSKVVKAQTELCNELMAQAMELAKNGQNEEAGRCLLKVKLGQPRNRAFMRAMEEPEYRRMMEKYELFLYQDTRKKELYRLKEELFFSVEEKTHDADLMEKGRKLISPDDPQAFILPDIGTAIAEMDEDPRLTEQDKARKKRELYQRLDETGQRLHTTSQLLKAYCIYEKDVEYVVKEGKVIIVDQNTGREMPGRRWSDGLHQAVEAKEGLEIERENQTYATITIQNYFRLYKKLAGMTGTAETEAAEFHDIYKLDVLPIPTNKPCVRKDSNDLIFKTRREKFNAVVAKIQELHGKGQPILIGTASVDASETLSRMLKRVKIPHEVLNAKNHQREAEIISQAGKKGAVTVSTNMAGRGTDIKLGEGVNELGGLFVLGTERHESRRIDRQLRGRCARQGDPGASQFFISFEDDLMRNFGAAERMTKMMERFGVQDGEALEHGWLNKTVENAQKRVEQRNYMWRKHVLDYDDVMNKQREVVYGFRNDVLITEDPRAIIYDVLEEAVMDKVQFYMVVDRDEQPNPDELLSWVNSTFPLALTDEQAGFTTKTPEECAKFIIEKVKVVYEQKLEHERAEYLDHMERQTVLTSIDKLWQEHLYNMDSLREGVRLRAQGQKDPLIEYKKEAYDMFVTLMDNINQTVLKNMFSSTTNLDAFEEFLASLPQSTSESEDDGEPNLTFDGMPANLLEALREQVSSAKAMRNATPERTPAPPRREAPASHPMPVMPDGMPISISASSSEMDPVLVRQDTKVELITRKPTVNICRKGDTQPQTAGDTPAPAAAAGNVEPSLTVGSMDSGSVLGTYENSGETLTR
ncbi:preprotein translocase subunit SecA [Akkermansia sp. N21116]|uniref:preprotein translocase subunit SecA n=1 Tax=Akkermansia sp. N21116 TaxID=3040764 RepID=UPI00244E734B|nr:preprotein translocase subunit SecA [Akkermansia sp. N21116]